MITDIQTTDLLARETVESMRDVVLSMDSSGTIIVLNPAAEQLLRVEAPQVLGRSFAPDYVAEG